MLERAKCAVWDTQQTPVMNQISALSNNYAVYVNTLDLPISGTNAVYVTNTCTFTLVTLATTPPTSVYMVKVDAAWPFRWKNKVTIYHNIVADYFAPD